MSTRSCKSSNDVSEVTLSRDMILSVGIQFQIKTKCKESLFYRVTQNKKVALISKNGLLLE